MNTVDFLKAVREKISRPESWTKHDYAKDVNGEAVSPIAPEAVCWCIRGAIASVEGIDGDEGDDGDQAFFALGPIGAAVFEKTGDRLIAGFNDTSTHEEVLAVLDRAVEIARENAK